MRKKYNRYLVLDICSCLKYESVFDTIDLKGTGKSFLSLFQYILNYSGNVYCEFFAVQ